MTSALDKVDDDQNGRRSIYSNEHAGLHLGPVHTSTSHYAQVFYTLAQLYLERRLG